MRITTLLATAPLLFACGAEPAGRETDAVGRNSQAISLENGRQLNGRQLNGIQLNGIQLNGIQLNGIQLNGIQLNGIQLNGIQLNGIQLNGRQLNGRGLGDLDLEKLSISLEGSELVATAPGGEALRGDALEGMIFQLGERGSASWLGVMGVSTAPARPDVFRYRLAALTRHGWASVCGDDESGAPIAAIPLSGQWIDRVGKGGGDHVDDPGVVTFACEGYALAKCVELGYRPWLPGGRALHQTCTRLIRADYCGDGRSHTEDGVWINVYDGLGIQSDTEDWTLEAEWSPEGARCLSTTRLSTMRAQPNCELPVESCGAPEHFASGTLLMSEYQPR